MDSHTAEKIDRMGDEIARLRAAEQRIRELHHCTPPYTYCRACAYAPMPCPTIRALDSLT
jgi:hypothetical protein